jgi:hypothetical protein
MSLPTSLAILLLSLGVLAEEPQGKDRLRWRSDEEIAREQRAKKESAERALESSKGLKTEVIELPTKGASKPAPKPVLPEKPVQRQVDVEPEDVLVLTGTEEEKAKQLADLYLNYPDNISEVPDRKTSCDGKKLIVAGFEVPSLPGNPEELDKARMFFVIQVKADVFIHPVERKLIKPLDSFTDPKWLTSILDTVHEENRKLANTAMRQAFKNSKAREMDVNLERLVGLVKDHNEEKYVALYNKTLALALEYVKVRDDWIPRRAKQLTYRDFEKAIKERLDAKLQPKLVQP